MRKIRDIENSKVRVRFRVRNAKYGKGGDA